MKSEHFDLVKNYYDQGYWSEERVRNAAGKWITADEAEEILSKE